MKEQRLGGLFKLELPTEHTAATYLKLGRLKIPLPMKHLGWADSSKAIREAHADLKTDARYGHVEPGSTSSPLNIVLGVRGTKTRTDLDEFGEHVNGISYHSFHKYGLLDQFADNGKWKSNLPRALHTVIDRGGRIKFDTTELSKQNPMTANEVRLIASTPKLLANTDFYRATRRGYRLLTDRERSALIASLQ